MEAVSAGQALVSGPDPAPVDRLVPYREAAALFDVVYSDAVKDYPAEVAELVAQVDARCPEAGSLLDVGCGTGRHLELLGERFGRLVGADCSVEMLRVARGRLGLGVELEVADMRSLSLVDRFDVVTCLFSGVGYLAGVAELELSVGRMAAHLSPGGVLVVDGWVRPECWVDSPATVGLRVSGELLSGERVSVVRLDRTCRRGQRSVIDMTFVVRRGDGPVEVIGEQHVLWLFGRDEYVSAFAAAGLSVEVVESPMRGRDRFLAVAPG